jgi:hypothetical protein
MTKRKWLRTIWIGGVLLLVASFGFSRALRAGAVRRYLIAHLAASFGRPVDVSWFDFSLLDGARIEAHFVSVSDDPKFGNEYFLRSDTLTAGLRWTALLAGRFEFGSVSLSRPSLNLACDLEGHWNIERWLPPAVSQSGATPGFVGPVDLSKEVRAVRPSRIDVEGGRINFKQGDSKNPFALVDVSGSVEQNGAGRWQLDLQARPMRAGVGLQDIGMLRLRGSIAGTTSRLQPADLNLTWRAASVADTLRLVSQDDYGMRGLLAVDLNARIAPPETSAAVGVDSGGAQWSISGVARFTGMHGWKLTGRDTDPAVNISAEVNWRPGERHSEIRKLLLEMPASHLQGSGDLDWAHGFHPELHIESSTLALEDVLSWYRALQPEVAEDLHADGALGLDIKLGGWPIQLRQGAIASVGGVLTAKSLPVPLQIGAVNASVSHGGLDFAPTEISLAPALVAGEPAKTQADSEARNSFVVRGALFPQANGAFRWPPDWNFSIEGATSRVQDWLALSGALAQPIYSDWNAAGGLAVKIHRAKRAGSPAVPWLGTMDFIGLDLSPTYMNQPVRFPKAHAEFAPLQETITLSAAEAFGAIWRGSITRKSSDQKWSFDLSADHIDAAELDRWLGLRARPSFLARLTSSNLDAAANTITGAADIQLAAIGRLRAGMIEVQPMHIEKFDGEVELAGRTVQIRKAQADFFGGKISASLEAQLLSDPSYQFQGRFDRVDLTQLGRAVAFLDGRIGGNASATLSLSAHGIGRQSLSESMKGNGTINARNVELRGFEFPATFAEQGPGTATISFSSAQGTFRIQDRAITLADFALNHLRGRELADGQIDFSHSLNLRLRPRAATAPASASPPDYFLNGTIENPKLVLPSAVPKLPARSATRPR